MPSPLPLSDAFRYTQIPNRSLHSPPTIKSRWFLEVTRVNFGTTNLYSQRTFPQNSRTRSSCSDARFQEPSKRVADPSLQSSSRLQSRRHGNYTLTTDSLFIKKLRFLKSIFPKLDTLAEFLIS